jgi:hypothetical protein
VFDCHFWLKIEDAPRHYWEPEKGYLDERRDEEVLAAIEKVVTKVWAACGFPNDALQFRVRDGVVFVTGMILRNHPMGSPDQISHFLSEVGSKFPSSYGSLHAHSIDDWERPGCYIVFELAGQKVLRSERQYPAMGE